MRHVTPLLLLILFTACQANEENLTKEQQWSKKYQTCEQHQGASTSGILACMEEELKRQDHQLNLAYKEARKRLQPFRLNALKAVQRQWIAYRDAKCGFFNHAQSGSGGKIDEQQCLIETTITRTHELEELF